MTLESTVRALLDTIHDPCSVRMGSPRGLVGMGLVERVEIDDAAIRIALVLTGPGCFFYFQFVDAIERALAPVAGGRTIEVTVDDSILWTRDRMQTVAVSLETP